MARDQRPKTRCETKIDKIHVKRDRRRGERLKNPDT
jgi:hypothetical protein